ncbi:hypothetical protein GWE18_01055 [Bradyrhizobium sp. CSA112]|uniref:hypothetical protein n=1 Tax=Bradyrhizobium sp. CSA112 TaxID=2699170 RepID=UPI0023B1466C|nr:hypothetical protein [Bradyrhizobium sp. CSA112]MDE5451463.1 hypothetical protein [Bradyrhizobium sp. CSA112]
MTIITAIPSATTPAMWRSALLLVARLRRFFNRWAAATTAYHERQVKLFALHRLEGQELDQTRIYRGPIDDVVDKAAQLRKRRRLG